MRESLLKPPAIFGHVKQFPTTEILSDPTNISTATICEKDTSTMHTMTTPTLSNALLIAETNDTLKDMLQDNQMPTLLIVDGQMKSTFGYQLDWRNACELFPRLPGLHDWLDSTPKAKSAYRTMTRKNYVPRELSECLDEYGATERSTYSEITAARALSAEATKIKQSGMYMPTTIPHRWLSPKIAEEIIRKCGERQISPIFEDNLYDRWIKYQERIMDSIGAIGKNRHSKLTKDFMNYTKRRHHCFSRPGSCSHKDTACATEHQAW